MAERRSEFGDGAVDESDTHSVLIYIQHAAVVWL